MDAEFLLEGLSDSEIASFEPTEPVSQSIQNAEVSFLRNQIETLTVERYNLVVECNSRVDAATKELLQRVSELENKLSSVETELQIYVTFRL